MIQTLLKLGADPNFQDSYFRTPLMYAIERGLPVETIELMLGKS